MSWWVPAQFQARRGLLEGRMRLIRHIRHHFDKQGFFEVETPILQICPVMDTHIHAFATDVRGVDLKHERTLYLHTSPEFAMKKLMVAGLPQLYQICHVFRNGEDSRLHSPEFTMVEWYRAFADYRDIMRDCKELLRGVAEDLGIKTYNHKDRHCDPFGDWQEMSVCEAFSFYTGIDLAACLDDTEKFNAVVSAAGIRTAPDDRWDDLFFRVMAEKIEPYLGMKMPAILYDYPVSMASLSRRKPEDPRFAERFELYVCGIELANAFTELTDAEEQESRYYEEMKQKKSLYGETYPLDEDFIAALKYGMPDSAGIALGVDRLAMLATGADNVADVLWTGKI